MLRNKPENGKSSRRNINVFHAGKKMVKSSRETKVQFHDPNQLLNEGMRESKSVFDL